MKLNIPRHYITIMRNYAIFDDSIGHLQWRRGENTNLHDFPALDGDFLNFSTWHHYIRVRVLSNL